MPEALLAMGFADIACLDISREAQHVAQARLARSSEPVRWIVADITAWTPDRAYDVWHDRAVFHFLTEPQAQAQYASALSLSVCAGGVAIIGTFAPDGPVAYETAAVTMISTL